MISSALKAANSRLFPRKLLFKPEWLVLGVNNLCNLHCKMCDVGIANTESNFYENLVGTRPLNMPLELITKIIDQAANYWPGVKIGYAFTEPLIYPHLVESLNYASKKGLFTSVTTNALTLDKQAAGLVDAGLDELFISLDGPEAIHNEIRGNKSSFRRAFAGMEAIWALNEEMGKSEKARNAIVRPENGLSKVRKGPEISVFCVITEWNIGQLEDFLEFFRGKPLARVGFMHTNFTFPDQAETHNAIWGTKYPATASNIEEIDLTKMDLDALSKEISRIRKVDWGFPISFSPELNSLPELGLFYNQPNVLIGKRCNDAFRNIMIKSDGSVIPAHGRCYNLNVGNVYEQNLQEIWNSSILGQFRADLLQAGGLFPACARCCSAF